MPKYMLLVTIDQADLATLRYIAEHDLKSIEADGLGIRVNYQIRDADNYVELASGWEELATKQQ